MSKFKKYLFIALIISLMASCGLHRAVQKNDIPTVKKMLLKGKDVNKRDGGWTPLMYAAYYDYPEMAQVLIDNGANINAQFETKDKPASVDKKMIFDPVVGIPTYYRFNGFTPLHFGAFYNAVKTVEVLMKNGADKNIKDLFGKIPMDYVIEYNHVYVGRILEEY